MKKMLPISQLSVVILLMGAAGAQGAASGRPPKTKEGLQAQLTFTQNKIKELEEKLQNQKPASGLGLFFRSLVGGSSITDEGGSPGDAAELSRRKGIEQRLLKDLEAFKD